jgi:ribosomal protein S18 acetylase RimI-like enzyme
MIISVIPAEPAHLPALREVVDTVAREGRYLAFTKAPPRAQSLAFYEGLLQAGNPFFVALRGGEVVGWCDVATVMGESRSHIGVLGMGLLPDARHQGAGRRLLEAALARCRERGLSRVELSVRDDNHIAKRLYEKLGFETEGLRRRASIIGADVHDVWAMALLHAPVA